MRSSREDYRTLMSEKVFLRVAERARRVNDIDLAAIQYKGNELLFMVRSVSRPGLLHKVRVAILDLDMPKIKTERDLAGAIRDSKLMVACSCIAEGTEISTSRGAVLIENIKPGDKVLTKEGTYAPVVALLDRGVKPVVKVSGSKFRDIRMTKDHKVWNKGHHIWDMREIQSLETMTVAVPSYDHLFSRWKEAEITSIVDDGEAHVYDISLLDESHSFVANGLIVSNCEAFLYWGYKYKAWKLGYGLERETRRPTVRNPHMYGKVCKHLFAVMQVYPFWSKYLERRFREEWKKESDRLAKDPKSESGIEKVGDFSKMPIRDAWKLKYKLKSHK